MRKVLKRVCSFYANERNIDKDFSHLFLGSILLKLICFCISDDLSEDVSLKYEKRGGEVWVSLDQYKLSSPSSSKTPSNSKKDENLTLNTETKIAVMKFTNKIRRRQGLPAFRTIEK